MASLILFRKIFEPTDLLSVYRYTSVEEFLKNSFEDDLSFDDVKVSREARFMDPDLSLLLSNRTRNVYRNFDTVNMSKSEFISHLLGTVDTLREAGVVWGLQYRRH